MFDRIVSAVAAIAMMLVAGSAGAQVLVQSTFDSDAEGWTLIGHLTGPFVSPPVWSAGQLTHSAPSGDAGGNSFFMAPTSFLTALKSPSAIGGSISFDIGSSHETGDTFFSFIADVQVRAGTTRLRYVFPSEPSFPTHVSLDFTTSFPWHISTSAIDAGPLADQTQINSVLAGATGLFIRAEYWSSASPETAILDNVRIAAIPEPETYAMMLAGLGLLGFIARRRKQSHQAV